MSKSAKIKGSKPKMDSLTSVKAGGVTKPSKTPKSKGQKIASSAAKAIATKQVPIGKALGDKTDSETSSSDSSSDSDSEDEAPVKAAAAAVAPATNGKVNGANGKKAAADSDSDSSSEEDSDSDKDSDSSDSDSDADAKVATVPKPNGAKPNGAPTADESSESSDSDSDEDEDMADAKKASSDDDSVSSSDSDSESESESETKPVVKADKKRKLEDQGDAPTKKTKVEEGDKPANLWVGQLSWNIDDQWLGEVFSECEGYVSARVITHKDNPGKSRGFGYVDFKSTEAAQAAMDAMQGKEVDGRAIKIDLNSGTSRPQDGGYQNKSDQRAKQYGDTVSPESSTLFVGNLPFDIDNDAVYEHFGQAVEVKNVRLPTDQETGNLKGFGYVEFHSVEDAKTAFEQCRGMIGGRTIRMDYAQSRPQNQNGGGFGGGDGKWARGGGRGGFGGRGGGRGGFGDRGGRGGGRGGFGDRGGRGRGGFGGRGGRGGTRIDVGATSSENKITFD